MMVAVKRCISRYKTSDNDYIIKYNMYRFVKFIIRCINAHNRLASEPLIGILTELCIVPNAGKWGQRTMISQDLITKIREVVEGFPLPHKTSILEIWDRWVESDPAEPYYESWSTFASKYDDNEALYTEMRVYIKRVANELREIEVPPTMWQKVAKALAAVASIFLVVILAISRVARASE